ncbi:MAG: phage regulatory CII family protein [Sulfurimonas sp.]|nr:phage regulatory CII family protein [Sulfurimonas sp.]PHQ90124.1 MAG: hypothetical protein COB42_05780 [Sulfurimonas sp.]
MTNEYRFNKRPKDPKLCKLIHKTIVLNCRQLDLKLEDVAHELGLAKGTLENKLKPSSDNDFTVSEFIHFMELIGNYDALQYLAGQFDLTLIENAKTKSSCCEINTLVDSLSIENSDVFKTAKAALQNGEISSIEKFNLQKEIQDVITVATQLQEDLKKV